MNPRHSVGTPTAETAMTRTHNMSAGGARSARVLPRAPYPPAARRPSSISTHMPIVTRPRCLPCARITAFRFEPLYSQAPSTWRWPPAASFSLQSQSNPNHGLVTPAHRPRLRPVSSPKHIVPALGPQRRPRCLRQVPWVRCLGSTTSRPSGSLRPVRRRRSAQRA